MLTLSKSVENNLAVVLSHLIPTLKFQYYSITAQILPRGFLNLELSLFISLRNLALCTLQNYQPGLSASPG